MDKAEQLMEEYKMLKTEMLHYMDKDTTLVTCLFSGVSAILFFALQRRMPEVCLLAYLVIIPVCAKLAYHQKQMAKISVYLSRHLEKELEVKWETYVSGLSQKKDRLQYGKILKFSECSMMAAAAMLAYGYLVIQKRTYEKAAVVFMMESILMTLLFIIVIAISGKIYKMKDYRRQYEELAKTINLEEGEEENNGTDGKN